MYMYATTTTTDIKQTLRIVSVVQDCMYLRLFLSVRVCLCVIVCVRERERELEGAREEILKGLDWRQDNLLSDKMIFNSDISGPYIYNHLSMYISSFKIMGIGNFRLSLLSLYNYESIFHNKYFIYEILQFLSKWM